MTATALAAPTEAPTTAPMPVQAGVAVQDAPLIARAAAAAVTIAVSSLLAVLVAVALAAAVTPDTSFHYSELASTFMLAPLAVIAISAAAAGAGAPSPGQFLCGLTVRAADAPAGVTADGHRRVVRSCVAAAAAMAGLGAAATFGPAALLVAALDPAWALVDRDGRSLHNALAGTITTSIRA